MKSRKVYSDELADQIAEHFKDMKIMVAQLRSIGMLLSTVKKTAEKKELEIIEDHLQEALFEVMAAYGTINQIFTIE
jgi:predicted DNA-binding protein with PD1-like motif